MSNIKIWEYIIIEKIYAGSQTNLTSLLEEKGNEGWELTHVSESKELIGPIKTCFIWFKREKQKEEG